jgi:hypothetical protein
LLGAFSDLNILMSDIIIIVIVLLLIRCGT